LVQQLSVSFGKSRVTRGRGMFVSGSGALGQVHFVRDSSSRIAPAVPTAARLAISMFST
jgi:hypothetical protein